jgi:hypothetical protein
MAWLSFNVLSSLYYQSSCQVRAKSLRSTFRYTFCVGVLEPDFTPVAIDGLSLNRLSAMRLWSRIGSGLIHNLRGFSEKLHCIG